MGRFILCTSEDLSDTMILMSTYRKTSIWSCLQVVSHGSSANEVLSGRTRGYIVVANNDPVDRRKTVGSRGF